MSKKLFLLAALFGAFTLFTTSCVETDPCKDVDCGPNGTCFEGTCECNDGFEGDACDIEWATKFLGSYLGSDNVTASTAGTTLGVYTLAQPAVVTRLSETKIRISNFGGFESFLDATIQRETPTSLTAEELDLTFTDPTGRKFTGTAKLTGSALTGTYRVTFSDNTYDDATFNYTK